MRGNDDDDDDNIKFDSSRVRKNIPLLTS
jgi:hypothetical protein